MSLLSQVSAETWVQCLGWSLIHFIWQGAVVALIVAFVLHAFPGISARARYAILAGAFFWCGTLPVVTCIILSHHISSATLSLTTSTVLNEAGNNGGSHDEGGVFPILLEPRGYLADSWKGEISRKAGSALPLFVGLWLIGVWASLVRLTLGGVVLRRICRSGMPIPPSLCLERFHRLMKRMQIARPVRLLHSTLIEVPTLVGWLRPVILLPSSVLVGLTPDQLESILVHELAHVRRYDYLMNLLQTLLETLLFYHPAIWWLSGKLRDERENCCDDIVIGVTKDRLAYVSALAQLEEKRMTAFALTASGGSLVERIRRIAGQGERKTSGWPLWTLIAGVLALLYLADLHARADKDHPSLTAGIQMQLEDAVRKGDALAVKSLLDHGADPAAIDKTGDTLLFQAGSPEVAELLVDHGVSPKVRDRLGITALSRLCLNGGDNTAAIARVLLEHGADPNSRNGSLGTTPLMGARDGATVDVLVKYGADVKAVDHTGEGVLYWCTFRRPSTFEALIRHGAPFDVHTNGPTLLMYGAQYANLPLVKWLLDHGVDPNLKGTWTIGGTMHSTPLLAAVGGGRFLQRPGADDEEEIVKLLLAHGAKVTYEMGLAVSNQRPVLVKMFWDKGIRNISELSYRISQGASVEEIRKLLDQGIPADPPQDRQATPLTVAAGLGRMDLVQLLLQRGADPNRAKTLSLEYPRGITPLQTSASLGEDDIVEYLLHHGAQAEPGPLLAATNNSFFVPMTGRRSKEQFEHCIALLIDAGALRGATPEQKGEVLARAIQTDNKAGNPAVLKRLLDAGLSPGLPVVLDDNGKTSVLAYCQNLYRQNRTDEEASPKFKVMVAMLEQANSASPVR